jgi:hypothetical protein
MQDSAGRVFVAILAICLASGCPSNRKAQESFTGGRHPGTIPLTMPVPPALSVIGDLRAPESVLHDRERDLYYISNINGGMLTRDGNGFISRVDPRTMRVELEWIAKGLDAPNGMAILGETLYVSDITAVKKFDRRTGAPRGEVPLPGATFINDIATDGRNLYVSDTGIAVGPGVQFVPTGTDAIWKITPSSSSSDRATKIASGRELRNPNGLDFLDGKLRVVTFGSNELYELDGARQKTIRRFPGEQLDGLVHLEDGSSVVTSWEADEIFLDEDGKVRAILASIPSPADIGYDSKRHRLLVPRPMNNQVTIHPLE